MDPDFDQQRYASPSLLPLVLANNSRGRNGFLQLRKLTRARRCPVTPKNQGKLDRLYCLQYWLTVVQVATNPNPTSKRNDHRYHYRDLAFGHDGRL
jgi:hypothetical protein